VAALLKDKRAPEREAHDPPMTLPPIDRSMLGVGKLTLAISSW
jgi:hypothetical protein